MPANTSQHQQHNHKHMTVPQFRLLIAGICALAVLVAVVGTVAHLPEQPINIPLGVPVLLLTTAAIMVVWRRVSRP